VPGILLQGRDRKVLLLELLPLLGKRARGFAIETVIEKLQATGYKLRSLDGREAVVAHKQGESPHRWGAYKVFVPAIDEMVAGTLREPTRLGQILVIDEIGEMLHYSTAFQQAVRAAFDSGTTLVATLGAKPEAYVARLKALRDVAVIEVNTDNRLKVKRRVMGMLGLPV
jgi:nucleoside-triphosphatase